MTDPLSNPDAEASVLGAALIGYPDALLTLGNQDFYTPAHTVIAATIRDMTMRGLATDPITVTNELEARNRLHALRAVGGSAYLWKLLEGTPGDMTASWHAAIVRAATIVREAHTAALELADATTKPGATDEVHALIQQHQDRMSNLPGTLGNPDDDDAGDTLGAMLVYAEKPVDWVIPGHIARGDRVVIVAGEGMSKALALDTPIPTPKGWTTMGHITPGQEIFAGDGSVTRVVLMTEIQYNRPCYRVTFSDGATIVADHDHLWLTETLAAREAAAYLLRRPEMKPDRKGGVDQRWKRKHYPEVITTGQIRDTLRARSGHALNHSVEVCEPLQYPKQELPLDPYVLGAWLGDGSSDNAIIWSHPDDKGVRDQIEATGWPVRKLPQDFGWGIGAGNYGKRSDGFLAKIRGLGVYKNKHIPRAYIEAAVSQRLALLQGLMDTDGSVAASSGTGRGSGNATCTFSSVKRDLAEGVHELVLGLGIKAGFRERRATLNGQDVGPCFTVRFQTDLPVFRLQRKLDRLTPLRTRRAKLRYITAVEPVESVPVRCIQVDHPDKLYLAGRECIPTHNTTMCRQMAVAYAGGLNPWNGQRVADGARVLYVDAENSRAQSARAYKWIAARAYRPTIAPGWKERVIHKTRNDGVDISGRDRQWFLDLTDRVSPDVIILGPAYKLHRGDPHSERDVQNLLDVIDQVRVQHNAAVIIEAHAPHGSAQFGRVMRPFGSSAWLRWPEIVLGYQRDSDIPPEEQPAKPEYLETVDARGRREERDWPEKVRWGSPHEMPWVPNEEFWKPSVDESYKIPEDEHATVR